MDFEWDPAKALVVVHALRGEGTIRIISARKATSQERKLYGNH